MQRRSARRAPANAGGSCRPSWGPERRLKPCRGQPYGRRHAGVVDREVAHMQFVDRRCSVHGAAIERRGVTLPSPACCRRRSSRSATVAAPRINVAADREYGFGDRGRAHQCPQAAQFPNHRRRRSGSTVHRRAICSKRSRCRRQAGRAFPEGASALRCLRAAPSPRSYIAQQHALRASAPTA